MSRADRKALADAASSVPGVSAHPYYVQGTKPGHAFVRLERTEYPNAFGAVRRWNVVLVLPQDLAAAEQMIDDKQPQLYAALSAEMTIKEAAPQRLNIVGVGDLHALFITGYREEA